jgi:Tol biopolymer transport system component
MTLAPGTRIGPYEVTAQIGVGGMGEVYRATDTTLDREVAIKVLPAAFSQDGNRLARFEREAKTLASVNHTNIAAIYGLERWQGTCALVMELVEGLTLADRIALGPIPLEETLAIARQLAEALEVAHERGIVHRDFKPANIKIRPDGTVKVLDFGLAKATDSAVVMSGSESPTITTPAMTQAGAILGTAAYMSPEQARGGTVDKRADVWAFGVVLYEMLVGRRLFDEPSVSDTAAAVLKGELTLNALPAGTPASISRLIARCLTRDARRRLRDIGEARITIDDALANREDGPDAADRQRTRQQSRWRLAIPIWIVALIALAVAAVAMWAPWRAAPTPGAVTRLTTDYAADITPANPNGSGTVLLSPDGQQLVVVGSSRPGDRTRLYVRRLDKLEATPLTGTDGARDPFFSPDGRWIGFFADGKLKKIPSSGGAAITLADAPDDRGGSWADNGWIAFSPRSGEFPLYRVPSDGGTAQPLTTLDAGEVTHRWPQILPGGHALIYTASMATGSYESANIVVRSVADDRTRIVHRGGYHGQYLSTGHLTYVSQGTLFAAPFDLERLETTAAGTPVLSEFATNPGTATVQLTFSQNGTFVYMPGTNSIESLASIFWLRRDGSTQPLRSALASYRNALRFSPDGERLAVAIVNQQSDIWVYESNRDFLSRLTAHQSLDVDPVWTPDGRRIAFRSARNGVDNLYWQRSDDTGEPQRLTESKFPQFPLSWHPSGKLLAFREYGRETGSDIWVLPMEGDEVSGWKPGKPTVFLAGPFDETDASFSPDGQWLAYQSDESGQNEVYVRPFPGPGGRVQVSTAGGSMPRWSRKRKELFYASANQEIMMATYTVQGATFGADKPSLWAKGPFTSFDLHPDGERIAIVRTQESQSPARPGRLVFVFNFFEEVRRLASAVER